jgi:hypothetical protein
MLVRVFSSSTPGNFILVPGINFFGAVSSLTRLLHHPAALRRINQRGKLEGI